uniref:thrombospondin type-1 domain-containing protein 7A-like n=1 Tax=Myxine glutinosa TaxID=7769 RepID=UPI00358E4172
MPNLQMRSRWSCWNILNLVRFAWQVAEWGECQPGALLSNGDRRRVNRTGLCGGGLRFREVYCIQVNENVADFHQILQNEQGNFSTPATVTTGTPTFTATPSIADQRPVDDSLCVVQKPMEEDLCSIPCPADCLVSEWSTWSFCIPQSCPTTMLTQPDRVPFINASYRVLALLASG